MQWITPFIGRRYPPTVARYTIGQMNIACNFCQALRFPQESMNCCHNGKVTLAPLAPYPEAFHSLLTRNDDQAKNFRQNIRNYNSAMAFASFGANLTTTAGHGPYVFRIHGQIYHRSGTLYPPGSYNY